MRVGTVKSMLGGEACRCGSSKCGGVDGQKTRTHEAQGLRRDAFRCDFIGGLLSHSHSDERKEQKEVEDAMRILQQSLESDDE